MSPTGMRLLVCLVVGIALAGRLEAAGVPALEPIPQDLPEDARAPLAQRQAQLRQELSDLNKKNKEFAEKYGGGVVEGSPKAAAALAEGAALEADKAKYVEAANRFNEDVRQPAKQKERKSVPVGAAAVVRGTVEWVTSRGAIPVRAGTPIIFGGRYRTGGNSRLQILLLDETVFTMGPNSDIVVDEFVYDPDLTARKIAVRVTKGIFRWVTGKVARKDPTKMKVTLPVGDLGFRGTDAIIESREDKSAEVTVLEGLVDFSPAWGGPPVTLKPGQRLLVDGPRASVQRERLPGRPAGGDGLDRSVFSLHVVDPRVAERDWLKRSGDEPAAEAPLPDKARQAYERGLIAAEQEAWEVAIQCFTEAQKAAEREPRVLYALGLAHAKAGHKAEGITWLRAYLDAAPQAPNAGAVREEIARLEGAPGGDVPRKPPKPWWEECRFAVLRVIDTDPLPAGERGIALRAMGGEDAGAMLRLNTDPIVSESDLDSAKLIEREGTFTISIVLTEQGRLKLAEATKGAVGKRLAILSRGEVLSAGTVREPLAGGTIEISGGMSKAEAQKIVAALNRK